MTKRVTVRIVVGALVALFVTTLAGGLWALRSESGARYILRTALERADQSISIERIAGTLASELVLENVRWRGEAASVSTDRITVNSDVSKWYRMTWRILSIDIESVLVETVDNAERAPSKSESVAIPNAISLPVDLYIDSARVNGLDLQQAHHPITTLFHRISLTGRWVDQTLSVDKVALESDEVQIHASGSVDTVLPFPLIAEVTSRVALNEQAVLSSSTHLEGNLTVLSLNHTTAKPYALSVRGTLEDLLVTPSVNLNVIIDSEDIGVIDPRLPGMPLNTDLSISGPLTNLDIVGDASTVHDPAGAVTMKLDTTLASSAWAFERVSITFPDLVQAPQIYLGGRVDLMPRPHVDLQLSWPHIQWPLNDEARVSSVDGRLDVRGDVTRMQYQLASTVASKSEANGALEMSGEMGAEQVTLNAVVTRLLGGSLSATGAFRPTDGEFSIDVDGDALRLSTLDQAWPSVLNVSGTSRGVATSRSINMMVQARGDGTWRGYDITFDLDADATPEQLNLRELVLRSGETRITANGKIEDAVNLNWRINSPDLHALWPDLAGSIEGEGVFTGRRDEPVAVVKARGTNLRFHEMHADRADLDATLTASDRRSTGQLVVEGLTLSHYASQSIELELDGTPSMHRMTLSIDDTLGRSTIALDGRHRPDADYRFTLEQLFIDANDFGQWRLAAPVDGVLGGNVSLSRACLERSQSSLCTDLRSTQTGFVTDLRVRAFPIDLLAHFLPSELKARGNLEGGGEIVVDQRGRSFGEFVFELDDVEVLSRRAEQSGSVLRFGPSTLNVQASQDGTLALSADLPLRSGGGMALSASVGAGTRVLLERALSGNLNLNLPKTDFLADYVGELDSIDGALSGRLSVTGSLRQPQLVGTVRFEDGAIGLAGPGIEFTDVALTLQGKPDGIATLEANGSSGGGTVRLAGEFDVSSPQPRGRFDLKGQNVQVVNTREAQLWVSPDLTLVLEEGALDLRGLLIVPKARIDLKGLPKGTQQVSTDQVIVGQDVEKTETTRQLSAELDVVLGDDVYLEALGLSAKLAGRVAILEEPDRRTTANGEVDLTQGKYEAYGQTLDITTGRLVYAGGPIDQPSIDLRASRRPTADIEVGVLARGRLTQPQFSVFSTPAMSESDQLAYLLFGRPLNADAASENTLVTRLALSLGMKGGDALSQKLADELGVDQLGLESDGDGDLTQASLVIGKYLSPKLFVSYGIGLLEPVSTLKLEYALSSRWQLITESSSTRSGADAQYIFER